MKKDRHVLPVIVAAQFSCTSLWFAGNAVMGNLVEDFNLPESALGHLTSAVQFGFILGTLIFAILTIADRYSPSKVFLVSAFLGAIFNLGTIMSGNTFASLLLFRVLTGFFLAGIYPVGMKIAADYYQKGLGKSLGFLVGALVLGTAFPYLLRGVSADYSWQLVLVFTSSLAILGGLLIFIFVPDGPYIKPSTKTDFKTVYTVFKNKRFRSAAFGYFGHMWELYAFWAFVPIMLTTYQSSHQGAELNVPLWSFIIIGFGGVACVVGGYLSQSFGTKRIAVLALSLSGICCLLSPLVLIINSEFIVIAFLIFWGMVVVADSPLFSTLVAQNTEPETKGTALTIVNSIGFAITIISIQLLTLLQAVVDERFIYLLLAIGPALGLLALYRTGQKNNPVNNGVI